MLRIGLIGTGFVSGSHIAGIKGCAEAQLVALCGRDRPKAERLGGESGIAPRSRW